MPKHNKICFVKEIFKNLGPKKKDSIQVRQLEWKKYKPNEF